MNTKTNFLLLLFSTLTALLLGEFLIRIFCPVTLYTDERNLIYQYDIELGWFSKKNTNEEFQGSRLIHISDNSMGFRDIEHIKNDKPNIVFLGDSFVWGFDVEVNERFTEKLRLKLDDKFNFYNFGVSGYGTDQEYILLQRFFEKVNPKIVFVVFYKNDFIENSSNVIHNGYFKPYYTYKDSKLTLKGIPTQRSLNYSMPYLQKNPILLTSHVFRLILKFTGKILIIWNQKKLQDPTYQILEEMNMFLLQRNSKLVVALIDSNPEMENILAKNNIMYIDLNNNYRYSAFGCHWTPEGHSFVASKITNFLTDNISK